MISSQSSQKNLELPVPTHPKLKMKLTVDQIAYLFKLLYDSDLIDVRHTTEIQRFIIANFETPVTQNISAKNLANSFGNPDQKSLDFWKGMFRKFITDSGNY